MASEVADRLFISYASPDSVLATEFANLLRLGCNLAHEQVFLTARPGEIRPGTQFAEVIRDALNMASAAILLLTPSYYESRFCLAEAGALWVSKKVHVPVLVPPIDFHDLQGVQLGEQAVQIDRASDLDGVRDLVHETFSTRVPTGAWNEHRDAFLNLWTARFEGAIAPATAVPAAERDILVSEIEVLRRELLEVGDDRARLRKYTRELSTQNEQLRSRVSEPPPAPELDGDPTAQYIAEAEAAIAVAARHLADLPDIVREALFQHFHDGRPLTVGGFKDRFTLDVARENVEHGYLTWIEDDAQMVTARQAQPDVDAAVSALVSVREIAFDGSSFESRSEAGDWIKPFLKQKYGITDPTFELRPTWEILDFL